MIMIFWRGWGILAAILIVAVYAGVMALSGTYFPGRSWAELVAAWLAAAAVLGLDIGLRKYQEYDNPRPRHDFMFIPLRGWVFLLVCWGIYVFVTHH